jgi:hypothetical protein
MPLHEIKERLQPVDKVLHIQPNYLTNFLHFKHSVDTIMLFI